MKRLLTLIPLFIIACSSPSPEEKLIADYEQTLGDSKIDLKFKLITLTPAGEVKAADSLDVIFKEVSKNLPASMDYDSYQMLYDSCTYLTSRLKESIDDMDSLFNSKGAGGDYVRRNERLSSQYQSFKRLYEASKKVTSAMDPYINDPERLLAIKYDCTYSIENPVLNNAKQEVTKVYFLDPLKQKIIATD